MSKFTFENLPPTKEVFTEPDWQLHINLSDKNQLTSRDGGRVTPTSPDWTTQYLPKLSLSESGAAASQNSSSAKHGASMDACTSTTDSPWKKDQTYAGTGEVRYVGANGATRVEYPDGRGVIKYSDGTGQAYGPQKKDNYLIDKDGGKTWTNVTYDKNGQGHEMQTTKWEGSEGTTVRVWYPGADGYKSADGYVHGGHGYVMRPNHNSPDNWGQVKDQMSHKIETSW